MTAPSRTSPRISCHSCCGPPTLHRVCTSLTSRRARGFRPRPPSPPLGYVATHRDHVRPPLEQRAGTIVEARGSGRFRNAISSRQTAHDRGPAGQLDPVAVRIEDHRYPRHASKCSLPTFLVFVAFDGLRHRTLPPIVRGRRPLNDKFFVQPVTAVVTSPNLSSHKPAGNCASRDDDRA